MRQIPDTNIYMGEGKSSLFLDLIRKAIENGMTFSYDTEVADLESMKEMVWEVI